MRNIVWSRRALLALAALAATLVLPSQASAQTQVQLGRPVTAFWQPPLNESDSGTDNYQFQMDAETTWTDTGVTIPLPEYTYAIQQSRLTLGRHDIRVRACRQIVCGDAATAWFEIVRPVPGVPRGLGSREGQAQAAIPIDRAVRIAMSWSDIVLDRALTQDELAFLATLHPPVAPSKASVLDLLDRTYAALSR